MHFDKATIEKLLGIEAYDRLLRKLSGGTANPVGYEFELFNCAYEVIMYAYAFSVDEAAEFNTSAHHPAEVLVTQGAFAFVDDVVVDTPEITVFYQIKHVEDLTWTPELKSDFDRQKTLMDQTSRAYRLVLVTHRQDRAKALHVSESKYLPETVWVAFRSPDGPTIGEKARELMLCVQSEGNAHLVQWMIELAWMKGPRSETAAHTLARASELSRGAVKEFASSEQSLLQCISRIIAFDNEIEILKLYADGHKISYHLRWDENEFEGFVVIRNWCAFERRLLEETPTSARDLIMMAMQEEQL
ncbi:hypothetical protein DFR48_10515 [Ciceribacter lividus]|uniref:Uncharacterized protein n=1 Tax=Ciceribacter lividus TaxID=1197950 RepID=A0A6I7HLB1_9HYPH|nr:hypothetical protein [Ciceribacter lividus]RCW24678.1 hypothetical protein DFR48_10515 [Ciceribacter lividus]